MRRAPVAVFGVAILGLGLVSPATRSEPARGERVFQRCYSCHSVVEGETNLQGPNLRGVIGRRAGTLPGFEYSPAMLSAGREGGLVWTRAALETYLADPEAYVPGTAMTQHLPEAEDRRDVIDFLEATSR